MAAKSTTSSMPQQPPNYIKQSWRRDETNSYDVCLLRQSFVIAPDAAVPSSKIRQRIRNVYEERIRSLIVVRHDPWEKKRTTKELMKKF